jgi:sialidase-1
MSTILTKTAILWCVISLPGWAMASDPLPTSLQHFLGNSYFHTQELWNEGDGGRSIIAAHDGCILIFRGNDSSQYKRSTNGGTTWTTGTASSAARFGNAVLNTANGHIFLMNASSNVRSVSTNHGVTWASTQSHLPTVDRFGNRPTTYSSHQAGITLKYGSNAGRLLVPTRVGSPGNAVSDRGYAYSSAVYSDDGGQTWHTSEPFPVFGTGEAAIVELKDGRVLYNSREHMSIGNRFVATSFDGGKTWISPYRDPTIPDGPRGTSYGCMGGLIRLPVNEYDILIYSNLDTDAGELPEEIGGTRTRDRENITLWVSFDGGTTWPIKRLVFGGPAAYSNLGVGRAGSAAQGKIFLAYDGGPLGRNSAVQVAVVNLSWLLNGGDISDYLP